MERFNQNMENIKIHKWNTLENPHWMSSAWSGLPLNRYWNDYIYQFEAKTHNILGISWPFSSHFGVSQIMIWVRSGRCSCLVTWFCYHMIAKPGNKTATPLWPDPYTFTFIFHRVVLTLSTHLGMHMGDAIIYYQFRSYIIHIGQLPW